MSRTPRITLSKTGGRVFDIMSAVWHYLAEVPDVQLGGYKVMRPKVFSSVLLASMAIWSVDAELVQIANKPYDDGLAGASGGAYRIPAMAKSTNGVIVAVYDCRYNSSGDLPNAIDLAENWSGDNGATWSKPRVAVDVPNTNNYQKVCNIGDPCIVYDPDGDKFWLMGITGGGLASSHDGSGNSIADVVLYTRGTGENDTWQEWTGGPEGNRRSVKQMILNSLAEIEDNETLKDECAINGILQGPGHGIVQRQTVYAADGETVLMPVGSIVFPMQYFSKKSSTSGWASYSWAFAAYSTDGGATWRSTKLAPTQKSQESCIMELDDGSWVMMAKCVSGGERYFFRTTDYMNWKKYDSLTPSAACQGSCLWLGKGEGGKSRYVSCFAENGDRSNITLHYGFDSSNDKNTMGITWRRNEDEIIAKNDGGWKTASYNSLVMLDEYTLGILLEVGGSITFKTTDVSEILESDFTKVASPTPAAVWDGDFSATQTGYTLNINGNKLSADNSTITITNAYAGIDINAESSFAKGVTLLVRYSNLVKADKAKALATSCNDSNYLKDRTGVDLQASDKLWGMWYDGSWNDNGTASAAGVMPVDGVFAFTYEKTNGTYLYAGVSAAEIYSSPAFGASGLKSKSDTIWGVTVGGMRSGTTNPNWRAAQNMDVTAVAVFDKVLAVDEMNAYRWPGRVLFSNTNATPDLAYWTIPGTPKITIPAGLVDGLTEDKFVKISSLDFGYHDDTQGYTHAKRIAIKSGNTVWTSSSVVANASDNAPFPGKNDGKVRRLVYSFKETGCVLAVGTPYEISFLDGAGASLTKIRYALAKDAGKIIDGIDFNASYTPMMQLIGEVVSREAAGFANSLFDWTPGSAPTGSWFMAWKGEDGGAPRTVVGPDGTAQALHVTHRSEAGYWTPYCSDAATSLTNFTFATYGSADMVKANKGKYAALWCMGKKDNAKTALVKDSEGNICLVQVIGDQQIPAHTIVAGPVKGYHLFTVRFSQTGGASLQIDDGQIVTDDGFTTIAHAGLQIGSVRNGCNGPLEMGLGFAVLKMLAFDSSEIPSAQYEALCVRYPAVETMGSLTYAQNGGTLLLPSLTLTGGKLSVQQGSLSIPTGAEASLSALSLGDKDDNPSFGMDIGGTLAINTSSPFDSNDASQAYNAMKHNANGVVFGEWTGSGTVNVTGEFLASNTIVSLCHDSSSVAVNVAGGTFDVRGVTAKHANRASLVLSGNGTIDFGEYASCAVAIGKTYGEGTITGSHSWTDTDAITLNGEGYGTTFLADGIELVFSGPITGSGNATVDVQNGGSVEFKDWRGTGDIVVRRGSLKVPANTLMSGSMAIMAGGALDITTDDAVFSTASFSAQSITIEEGGLILVNGEPVSAGYTVDVSSGSIHVAPNLSEDDITHECVLRISEIMPKPTDALNRGKLEGMDVNGLESGWVEVENTSPDKWANLGDYKFIRSNRGKKTGQADYGNFPSVMIAPGARYVFYTSERYSNSADMTVSAWAEADEDGVKPKLYGADLKGILVWPDKVNPKKSPFVRLIYTPTDAIVDTVVVPSDVPEGCSIIVGDAGDGEATKRWICPTPTRGRANTATEGLVRIGPNAGPLYEIASGKKHDSANEFARLAPPAVPGEDYEITFSFNPVMHPTVAGGFRDEDAITNIVLVYRTDLTNATTIASVDMTTDNFDAKDWGHTYTATIPHAVFDTIGAGHLIQWKFIAADASGNEWTSPSFNNPDDGYEWYGTIVEPDPETQMSATLPTWHMFASGNHLTQMDVDADNQDRSKVPNQARVAIYDSSTSNYYDYVRIDLRGHTSAGFTKKGHGLRFAKAHPLTMVDSVTGETIEEIRKTSLISEFADPSYMRQMIAFWLWRKMGNLVPFDFPVRCNLNGEFYQLAFNSERFTDELIEDVYGLDKYGYGYKNVGTLKSGSSTTAGKIEKKTPDDENESDITVLQNELRSKITAAQQVSSSPDGGSAGLDNAALTRFVVEKFDLPAWLNYLASARITQEMDDVWANVCAYYDNPEMKDGVRGKGTWMPLGYDFNLSFGQYYIDGGISPAGLVAANDWYKSHPFYGGNRVRCYTSSAMASTINNGNDGFEAVLQSAKFRRLYLRRLRTLMDQELKAPGTPEGGTPFMLEMRKMAGLMRADATLDTEKWGNDWTDGNIDVWENGSRPANMDAGIQDIWDNYVVPRREHLYVTHSVTNTAKTIGYGSNLNAGIPEAQSPIETLAPNISISNLTALDADEAEELGVAGQLYDTEVVVIRNDNAEVVDMSGWRLAFSVDFTFPAGTVCDANDSIYIVADRRAYIDAHDAELTDQVIVGNAKFTGAGPVALYDADGALVYSAIPQTDELKYLRLHSFYGNTLDGDGDAGEWFTLTNISDSVTLDLADVTVCFLKQGDNHDATEHCHVTLTNKKGKGSVESLKSWTASKADYADKGWLKIQNNKQQITIYDKYGSVCQSLKVTQRSFPLAYGKGGYLVCDSTDAIVSKDDQWHESLYELANDGALSESFSADSQEAANDLVSNAKPVLSDDDVDAGLEPQYLKIVAQPVEGEVGKYKAVVVVNPDAVEVPVMAQIEEGEATVDPLTVESDEEGSKVTVGVSNARVGLWYGFIWTDSLGDKPFENDVESFKLATSTSVKIESKAEAAKSAQKAFFRVKVSATKP